VAIRIVEPASKLRSIEPMDTTLHFETFQEDELWKSGFSKDNKSQQLQMPECSSKSPIKNYRLEQKLAHL